MSVSDDEKNKRQKVDKGIQIINARDIVSFLHQNYEGDYSDSEESNNEDTNSRNYEDWEYKEIDKQKTKIVFTDGAAALFCFRHVNALLIHCKTFLEHKQTTPLVACTTPNIKIG